MAWLGDLGSAILGVLYGNVVLVTLAGMAALVAVGVIAARRGWIAAARRHRARTGALAAGMLAVALPVGWYLGSPLILTASIDEPAPVIAPRPSPSALPTPSATARPTSVPSSATPAPSVTPEPPPELAELSGAFHGSDEFHFGRGTARLIEVSPGTFVVRLEDFAVRNGPDLYVYLSPSPDGYTKDAIELGRLKADTGNQNYEVPAGALADPASAASIVIWCKQFSHLFATAPLAS